VIVQQTSPAGHVPHGPPLLVLLAPVLPVLPVVLPELAPVEPDAVAVPPPDELAAAIPPVPLAAVAVAVPEPLFVPPAPPPPNIRSGAPHPRNVAASAATPRRVLIPRSYGDQLREGKPSRDGPTIDGGRASRQSFLMRIGFRGGLGLALAGVVVTAVACGGNVVVGGGQSSTGTVGGAGGVGGTSSVTSVDSSVSVTSVSVGVTTGTGTGPACDCNQFCAIAEACQAPLGSCQAACTNGPPGRLACVCEAGSDCAAALQCFGAGSSSSASGGGTAACDQCVQAAMNGPCASSLTNCKSSSACLALWNCEISCGFTVGCVEMCTTAIPAGVGLFTALTVCSECMACNPACIGQPLFNAYCTGMGG
jgi:hypothetical protein